jgi:hypothetical protein
MKDPIQQTSGEVAFVIFDAPLPPRYFRIPKKLIRTLFVVVPIMFILSLAGFLFWGIGTRLKAAPRPNLSNVMIGQDSKVVELESELKALQISNTELAQKMADLPSTTAAEDPYLMTIKKPYGMQNLLNENSVSLDQFQLQNENNKVSLKFQIISSKPETKVTGNVLVFMISEMGMMAYPPEANSNLAEGIKYSMGEPFAVSRLRPTNAEFSLHLTGESVKFVIYIFSREGDLLHIRETESFKVSSK